MTIEDWLKRMREPVDSWFVESNLLFPNRDLAGECQRFADIDDEWEVDWGEEMAFRYHKAKKEFHELAKFVESAPEALAFLRSGPLPGDIMVPRSEETAWMSSKERELVEWFDRGEYAVFLRLAAFFGLDKGWIVRYCVHTSIFHCKGLTLEDRGDIHETLLWREIFDDELISKIKAAAEEGNARALNCLGLLHKSGWARGKAPIKQDLEKARDLFRRSAEAGCTQGMANYANGLADGSGGPVNLDAAERIFCELSSRGLGAADYALARIAARRHSAGDASSLDAFAAATAAHAGDNLVPADGLKWRLPSGATIEDGILTIDVPPGESGMNGATTSLDLSQCPDGFIAEIAASGENVSNASAPWLGLKFMVHYKDPEMGIDCYPDLVSRPTGMFSNTMLKLVDDFPGRVRQNPVLYLGLQGCSGKVVFDLSSLRLLKAEPAFAKVNQDYVVAYPQGKARPGTLRGFMTPDEPTEQDFADMAAMGATLVRYQMTRNTRGFDESRLLDFAAYHDWLEGRLAKLEEILAWCDRYGIEVVVDMHHTPGGVEKRGLRINYRRDCIDLFREYGWDWTYHAFRESPCWDVEKEGPDINHMVPCAGTPRKQALLEGLRP